MTEGEDIVRELSILEAECSPAYLLAQHNHESADPVQRAFCLIKKCSTLINQSNTLVDERIKAIGRCLEDFTGWMEWMSDREREKLSNSQICCLAQLCLAAA